MYAFANGKGSSICSGVPDRRPHDDAITHTIRRLPMRAPPGWLDQAKPSRSPDSGAF